MFQLYATCLAYSALPYDFSQTLFDNDYRSQSFSFLLREFPYIDMSFQAQSIHGFPVG